MRTWSIRLRQDYQYRAVISADEVADVVADQVVNIGYDNFKAHVTEPRLSRAFSQDLGNDATVV